MFNFAGRARSPVYAPRSPAVRTWQAENRMLRAELEQLKKEKTDEN